MAIIKVKNLDDRVQDYWSREWQGSLYQDGYGEYLVDDDLVFERLEKENPLLFDKIKNPWKYKISRWELLDV